MKDPLSSKQLCVHRAELERFVNMAALGMGVACPYCQIASLTTELHDLKRSHFFSDMRDLRAENERLKRVERAWHFIQNCPQDEPLRTALQQAFMRDFKGQQVETTPGLPVRHPGDNLKSYEYSVDSNPTFYPKKEDRIERVDIRDGKLLLIVRHAENGDGC